MNKFVFDFLDHQVDFSIDWLFFKNVTNVI